MTAEATRVYGDAAVAHARVLWKEGVSNAKAGSTTPLAMDSGWGTPLKKADGTVTDWCGFFVAASLYRAGLSKWLRRGFWHVDNVRSYFTYHYGDRVPRWVWDEATCVWNKVHDLHAARGSKRRWLDHAAIDRTDLAALDILPGDVVLIDHEGDGKANHITMAESYDPATGVLVTIEGNGVGEVAAAVAADGSVTVGRSHGPCAVRNARNLKNGAERKKIFAVGRVSTVDFETLPYDKADAMPTAPPPDNASRAFGVGGHDDDEGDDGGPIGAEPATERR
jgi:hypothetical protein